jgi:hypothetical protein
MRSETLQASPTVQSTSLERKPQLSERTKTALAAWAVAGIVVMVFWKTIFRAVPISNLYLIGHWDSLFAAFRQGVLLPIDPSGVLESFPYYTQSSQQLHAGMLPLWNHLNAFGAPLCGDLEATVFSPLRWLFYLVPCAYTYNLQLVVQVLVSALGAFALTRTLGAGRGPSIFAALAFGLCPFMLWYLELQSGTGFVLYPAVLWLFARAAKTGKSGDAVWAGIGSGLSVLIGHPEPAFFGTAIASTLMALIAVPSYGWIRFIRLLAVAGVSAVCVAAPALFPFLEFVRSADCYKFGVSNALSLHWQALAYNLLSPAAGGASPYLGVLVLPLVAIAFTGKRRKTAICLAIICVLAAIPAANLWPFCLVSQQPPFSYLITIYFVPIFLLAMAVLSAIGLTNFLDAIESGRAGKQAAVMAVVACLSLAVPFMLQAQHVNLSITNFDVQLPDAALNLKTWHRDAAIGGIFVFTVLALLWWRRRVGERRLPAGIIAAGVILVLNFVSVASVAKTSLTPCPSFAFPVLPVTTFLKESGERCLAMTAHILKPNVNVLYGIEDLRSMNSMWPKRYLKFVTACGADCDQYNQIYNGALSSLLDLGSVKYVLSQSPVLCKDDPTPATTPFGLMSCPLVLADGVTVSGGGLWTDAVNAAAGGYLTFVQPSDVLRSSKLRLIFVVKNAAGDFLWFSDRLTPVEAQAFTLALPSNSQDQCKLYLRLFDSASGRFVSVAGHDELPMSELDTNTTSAKGHFVLERSYRDSQLRIYRNTGSLPHAYVCFNGKFVSDEKQAFETITSKDFDSHSQVALECGEDAMIHRLSTERENAAIVPATIVQRRPAQTMIEYRVNDPGWLVLTDTFYPGWNAYLDGKRVPIVRANYLFRAIAVPAGAHRVVFRYEPVSFYAGLLTALSFIAVLTIFALLRRRTN